MNRSNIRNGLLALAVALGLLLPAAAAQGWLDGAQTTGTVTGTMDESELAWHTYELQGPDGPQGTATYSVFMDMFETFTLQAHLGDSMVEGALSISFMSFGGPLSDCPCELQGEITYWTTTSMFANFLTGEAVVVIQEAERLADGSYRLSGTAKGELLLYESTANPVPTGDPVVVELGFTIESVVPQELGLD